MAATGYAPPKKTPQGEVAPPFATSLLSFMLFSLVFLLGWLRDIIENVRGHTRKVSSRHACVRVCA